MAKEYKVAGITNYIDNIMEFAFESDDFQLTRSELRKEFEDGDRVDQYYFDFQHVELVEEPDNEYDPNAIRIDVDGLTIGYVPKEQTAEVKNKMHAPDYAGIKLTEIHYGQYWDISEDDDGKLQIDKDEYPAPYARFEFIRPAQPAPESAAAPERPPLDKKTKFGAASTLVLIFGIIMMFVAMPIGLILFIVGIVLLIRSRRS